MPESSGPYTYPGTDVLRNIPDLHDSQRLAAFEANATTARLAELDAAPLKGEFDVAHLKAIHKYIFQDVYVWAGEFRTVNVSKGGSLFGAAPFVELALDDILLKLRGERYLKGSDLSSFARFIRELGFEAGFMIDWSRINQHQMMAASRESFSTGDSSGLATLILASTS